MAPDRMPSTACRRIIILTGAPQSEQLDWHEDQLHQQVDLTFGRTSVGVPSNSSDIIDSYPVSKWRTVNRLLSPRRPKDDRTEFLPSGLLDHQTSLHRLEQVFPGRSLAFLEDAAVSGTVDSTAQTVEDTMQSFYSALTESDRSTNMTSSLSKIPPNIAITHLKDIPNAKQLPGIAPQERMMNLLVGIIAVQPLRAVRTRRHNARVDIVEVVIGDDTKAGFSITNWLVPGDDRTGGSLRLKVLALRPKDLVLITNIALSTYNGCVYGQSTSRRTTRDGTRIFKVQDHRHELCHLDQKTESLVAWAERFLGHAARAPRRKEPDKEVLPPETPDGS